jgi:hypothetical protein
MATKIIRSGNNEVGANNILTKIQDLLAGMQYQIGATLYDWFSTIYPFVEISQVDGQPVVFIQENDYRTLLDDTQKAIIFFLLGDMEQQQDGGIFLADVSMFVWYRPKNFSKFRSIKQVLISEISNKVIKYLPPRNIQSLRFIVNSQDVWRGLNIDMYELQSTQPFDVLRVDMQLYIDISCLDTYISDINDLSQCN